MLRANRYRLSSCCIRRRQQRDLMPYLRHLKRLGIQASIRMVETAQYYERLRNYQFDMMVDTMPQSLTPGAGAETVLGQSGRSAVR